MSLADLAHRESNGRPARECTICYATRTLPESDAADLIKALGNPAAGFSEIATELGRLGFPVNDKSVGRHARGDCASGGGRRYR